MGMVTKSKELRKVTQVTPGPDRGFSASGKAAAFDAGSRSSGNQTGNAVTAGRSLDKEEDHDDHLELPGPGAGKSFYCVPVVINSPHAVIQVVNTQKDDYASNREIDLNALRKKLATVKETVPALEQQIQEHVLERLDEINRELEGADPDRSKIKTLWQDLKGIVIGGAGAGLGDVLSSLWT